MLHKQLLRALALILVLGCAGCAAEPNTPTAQNTAAPAPTATPVAQIQSVVAPTPTPSPSPEYQPPQNSSEYYILSDSSGKKGLISPDGQLLLDFQYDAIEEVRDRRTGELRYFALHQYGNGNWREHVSALATPQGELVSGFDFRYGIAYAWGNFLVYTLPDGYALLRDGTFETLYELKEGENWFFTEEGPVIFNSLKQTLRFYDMDMNQRAVLEGISYASFGGGMFCLSKEGKSGFCNLNGEIVIPFQFDLAYPFSEGVAAVLTNAETQPYTEEDGSTQYSHTGGAWGFIDESGQEVIKPLYDNEKGQFTEFKNGAAIFQDGNGTALFAIDHSGNFLDDGAIRALYYPSLSGGGIEDEFISGGEEGSQDRTTVYYITPEGERILLCENGYAQDLENGLILVEDFASSTDGLYDPQTKSWRIPLGRYVSLRTNEYTGALIAVHEVDEANVVPGDQLPDKDGEGSSVDSRLLEFMSRHNLPGPADCDLLDDRGNPVLNGLRGVTYWDGARAAGWKDGVYGLMDAQGEFLWTQE